MKIQKKNSQNIWNIKFDNLEFFQNFPIIFRILVNKIDEFIVKKLNNNLKKIEKNS